MKTDKLQELIDWDNIMKMPRCAGGHDEQMIGLFKGATVIAHHNDESYQGEVGTAVRLADGRYCWYQDSYGSCTGCDSWQDASDDEVRTLCINMAIDAEVFDSLEDMLRDMLDPGENRDWASHIGSELAKIIQNGGK